jgi:hypothetical protein
MNKHRIDDFLDYASVVIYKEFTEQLEKNGILLAEYKPTFPPIVEMNKNRSFIQGIDYPYMKDFFCGRMVFEHITDFGLDFLTEEFKEEIKNHANEFSCILKHRPNIDLIFSIMPEVQPFPTILHNDTEMNFKGRAYIGSNWASNDYTMCFDYNCLFVERIRETFKDVFVPTSLMNEEELKLYDKQPSRNEYVA